MKIIKVTKFNKDGFTLSYEGTEKGDTVEWYQIPNSDWCASCDDETDTEDDPTGEGFKPSKVILFTIPKKKNKNNTA